MEPWTVCWSRSSVAACFRWPAITSTFRGTRKQLAASAAAGEPRGSSDQSRRVGGQRPKLLSDRQWSLADGPRASGVLEPRPSMTSPELAEGMFIRPGAVFPHVGSTGCRALGAPAGWGRAHRRRRPTCGGSWGRSRSCGPSTCGAGATPRCFRSGLRRRTKPGDAVPVDEGCSRAHRSGP